MKGALSINLPFVKIRLNLKTKEMTFEVDISQPSCRWVLPKTDCAHAEAQRGLVDLQF